jgi:hypothetical protein
LSSAVRAAPLKSALSARRLTSQPVDFTQGCDDPSGTEHIFGDVNANGTGTVNVVWTNCRTGNDTLNRYCVGAG